MAYLSKVDFPHFCSDAPPALPWGKEARRQGDGLHCRGARKQGGMGMDCKTMSTRHLRGLTARPSEQEGNLVPCHVWIQHMWQDRVLHVCQNRELY